MCMQIRTWCYVSKIDDSDPKWVQWKQKLIAEMCIF